MATTAATKSRIGQHSISQGRAQKGRIEHQQENGTQYQRNLYQTHLRIISRADSQRTLSRLLSLCPLPIEYSV